MGEKIKWTPPPEAWVCPHCGTAIYNKSDRCVNCEKDPFKLPDENTLLTKEQLETLKAATRRNH